MIDAISGVLSTPASPTLDGTQPLAGATIPTQGADPAAAPKVFDLNIASVIDSVQAAQAHATELGIRAVTGDLDDVHDYTIAAAQASTMLELTAAVRNKAVEAFNEIMRMQA